MACPFCGARCVLVGSRTCGEPACIRAAVWAGRSRNALNERTRVRAEAQAHNETAIARATARSVN